MDFYRDKKKEKLENPTKEVDLLLGCDKKIVFVLTERKFENPTEEIYLLLGRDKNICFYFEKRFRSSNLWLRFS